MSTIFALISSPHASSVAVIRISGAKAFDCIREFGFKKKITPRFCYFHQLKIKNSDEILDEALITFFPNPQIINLLILQRRIFFKNIPMFFSFSNYNTL